MRVWRTGVITGRAVAAKGVELPESFSAYVESPPQPMQSPPVPRGTKFLCPIAQDGAFHCELPAETLDLAFRSKGLTSHYRWGVAIKPGEKTSLGTLTWKRGASLVVWLDRQSAQSTKGEAIAVMTRMTAGPPSVESARLSAPVAETKFTERGYAQLAPLAAGTYRLSVSAPGFSTTSLAPIEIYEGNESVLRKPIVLEPPITIALAIEPPLDAHGRPWKVQFDRRPDPGASLGSGHREAVAAEDGTVEFDSQSPGRFHISIRDADGNRVAFRDVVISSAADAFQRIAIEQYLVRGTLTLGDDPLEAEIFFGTEDGSERVAMKSDPDGAFKGALPRLGPWPVEVRQEAEAVRHIRVVQVAADEDLDIRIPSGSISGRVVDSEGNPAPGAMVMIGYAAPFGRSIEADSRGEFRVRGVGGRVTLSAQARRTQGGSAQLAIEVAEGSEVRDITLRLVDPRDVSGRVTVAGLPQAGASVTATPAGGGEVRRATTDLDGRFTLSLREDVPSAHFTIAVAGRTIAAFHRPLSNEPLAFDIEPVGGDLTVILNEKSEKFVIYLNGAPLGLQELFAWAEAHGGDLLQGNPADRLRIPSVARGVARACSRLAGGGEVCRDAAIVPRGSATIDLR